MKVRIYAYNYGHEGSPLCAWRAIASIKIGDDHWEFGRDGSTREEAISRVEDLVRKNVKEECAA